MVSVSKMAASELNSCKTNEVDIDSINYFRIILNICNRLFKFGPIDLECGVFLIDMTQTKIAGYKNPLFDAKIVFQRKPITISNRLYFQH